jgi:hypothetical protein
LFWVLSESLGRNATAALSIAILNVAGCIGVSIAAMQGHIYTKGPSLTPWMLSCKKGVISKQPIPEAALLKAWVCGRSHAGIVGLNPAEGTVVCLLCVVM